MVRIRVLAVGVFSCRGVRTGGKIPSSAAAIAPRGSAFTDSSGDMDTAVWTDAQNKEQVGFYQQLPIWRSISDKNMRAA